MTAFLVALPILCLGLGAAPTADPLFLTLEAFQPIEEGIPFVGLRAAGVFESGWGAELAASTTAFFGTIRELSGLRVVSFGGAPIVVRAGVSFVPGSRGNGDIGTTQAMNGLHAGASLLTGDERSRVRARFDYTFRWFDRTDRGFSAIGIGLVIPLQ